MFKQYLQKALHGVDGADACILMGLDGIPIDAVFSRGDKEAFHNLGTEYSTAVARVVDSLKMANEGGLKELTVFTSNRTVVARVLTEEYLVLLFLKSNGNSGKARFVLRILAPRLIKEMG